MQLRNVVLAAMGLTLAAAPAVAASWSIDPAHSIANFKVRHLAITNVSGTIGGVNGTVDINDADITKSTVKATLDARTVNTGNPDRDKHLRSPDFFNVGKCPTITFVSKSVSGTAADLKVHGALTMNCVTKDVDLAVEGPTAPIKGMQGDHRRGLTASVVVNRKDFNIVWNKNLDGGGVVVSDDVRISIDAELTDNAKPAH